MTQRSSEIRKAVKEAIRKDALEGINTRYASVKAMGVDRKTFYVLRAHAHAAAGKYFPGLRGKSRTLGDALDAAFDAFVAEFGAPPTRRELSAAVPTASRATALLAITAGRARHGFPPVPRCSASPGAGALVDTSRKQQAREVYDRMRVAFPDAPHTWMPVVALVLRISRQRAHQLLPPHAREP